MGVKKWRSVKLSVGIIDALEAHWPELSKHPTVKLLGIGDSLSARVTAGLYLLIESKPPRRRRAAPTPPAGASETAPVEAGPSAEPEAAAVANEAQVPDALPDLARLEPERFEKILQAYRDGMPAEELAGHMNSKEGFPVPPGGWTGAHVERLVNGHART